MADKTINLRAAGNSLELSLDARVNRLIVDVQPDTTRGGFGTAVVLAEWSIVPVDFEDDDFPQTWHGFTTAVQWTAADAKKLDVAGARRFRLRVATADGAADPLTPVLFNPTSESV